MSWTARGDAAEAAAVILTSDRAYDGPVTLTASSAPTFAEVAVTASGAAARDIECVVVGEDEWLATQVAGGRPEFVARFQLGMYQAAAAGFSAGVDPLLGALLGREPAGVREVLAAATSH